MTSLDFDVVVVGGGPAGAAAALRLARRGVGVGVLDAGPGAVEKFGESLAPSSRLVLERLGLWAEHVAAGHLPCYCNRSSWGGDETEEHDFLRDPYGHGWHLDRGRFDAMVKEAAIRAGCHWLDGARVRAVSRNGPKWELRFTDRGAEGSVKARFLIDAGGRSSHVARRAGVRRIVFNRLVAHAAFLVPTRESRSDAATLIEAEEHGWWYSAPVPDGRLACCFMTDAGLARRELSEPVWWWRRLRATRFTRERVEGGGYRLVSAPVTTSASSCILDRAAGEGWAAAGDAAAAYDPLSSHGIATALATGWEAGGAAIASLAGGGTSLEAYAARIRRSFVHYLELRTAYYAMERRWPSSQFWRRRAGPPAAAHSARERTPSLAVDQALGITAGARWNRQ